MIMLKCTQMNCSYNIAFLRTALLLYSHTISASHGGTRSARGRCLWLIRSSGIQRLTGIVIFSQNAIYSPQFLPNHIANIFVLRARSPGVTVCTLPVVPVRSLDKGGG